MRWVKLGDFIEQCDERNVQNCSYPVIGINKDKEFMPTVANTDEIDLKKYKIIRSGQFIFSGMQTGRDVCIRIGLYNGEPALISPAYTTFIISTPNVLLPEYVFMYFKRSEMDRYGWFISDSSVRSNLDWSRFLDINIPLPSMDKQKEIVATWRGLKNLYEQNEQMANPLMDLCQSYLQELKHKYPLVELGEYIEPRKEKNTDDQIKDVYGVSVSREFITASTTVDKTKLKNYKIVNKYDIAYVPTTHLHIYAIAISDKDESFVVSPIYEVFFVTKPDELLPEYLFLWLNRKETERFAYYNSWGSARENFNFADMCRVKIPLAPMEIQRAIVEIYNCAQTSKYIAARAKQLSNDVCPALVRQVIGDNQ